MNLTSFKNFLSQYKKSVIKEINEVDMDIHGILDILNSTNEDDFKTHTIDITSQKEIMKSYLSYDDIWYKHLERKAGYLYDKEEGLKELRDFLTELNISFNAQLATRPIEYLEGLFFVCDKALKDNAIDILTVNKIIGCVIYYNAKNSSLCHYSDEMKRKVFQLRHFYNMQGEFQAFLESKYLRDLYYCLLGQFENNEKYDYIIENICVLYDEYFEEYLKKISHKSKVADFEEYRRTRNVTYISKWNIKKGTAGM